ncbi:ATP-binding protein [Roseovarius faecimaris]|uniref:ATP-binding protein n=1 Tax=Roseovarius faecimaris TaxID=2494550 RepID=A0A6I6IPY7_9RHOB|nr:ATP-binding protein [Roseovarius faecimaris]QGX98194.1 ATP-binding protein [Roseovarius faecimaris]
MTNTPTLHLLCGKIASGKSTLATELAKPPGTVLIAEDAWLAALFGDQMHTPRDFLRCSAKLQGIMGPHVAALLNAGLSVVLDFQANTVEARRWMRSILDATSAAHQLHLLDATDALCLARLQARNAEGAHPFAATEAQFHAVTRHFAPPTPDEGFTILRHPQA